jgi:large subunit ribosomal protein L29
MTKRTDSLHSLRQLTDSDLAEHLRERRRKLFEVRFQQATGQVENHRQVREIRRDIARALTVQIESQRRAAAEARHAASESG